MADWESKPEQGKVEVVAFDEDDAWDDEQFSALRRGDDLGSKLRQGGGNEAAIRLAEPGVYGDLSQAQKLYAEFGNKLQSRGMDRTARVVYREARRILESAWGLDAVRKAPARMSPSYARVMTPDRRKGRVGEEYESDSPLAVHYFQREQRPSPGGGMVKYWVPGETYYGQDALTRASARYVRETTDRIGELESRSKRLREDSTKAGIPANQTKLARWKHQIEQLKRELGAFKGQAVEGKGPAEEVTGQSFEAEVRARIDQAESRRAAEGIARRITRGSMDRDRFQALKAELIAYAKARFAKK